MARRPLAVGAGSGFGDIVDLFLAHAIDEAPVVDSDGSIVGMISVDDLLPPSNRNGHRRIEMAVFFAGSSGGSWLARNARRSASDIARAAAHVAHPNDDVRAAAMLMDGNDLDQLPVADDGRLVGVASRSDVLHALRHQDGVLRRAVLQHLWRCAFVPPTHAITVTVVGDVVTLEGCVPAEKDADLVGRLVAAHDGVRRVDNRLAGRAPSRKTRSS